MKRYLLFGGVTYYPCGGWSDFRGSFNTAVEAVEVATKGQDQFVDYDWWHVVNAVDGKIVAERAA